MLQSRVVVGVVAAAVLSCSQLPLGRPVEPVASAPGPAVTPTDGAAGPARLRARPRREVTGDLRPGLRPLRLGADRDGVIYIPPGVEQPAPLVLMLHGSGGVARRAVTWWLDHADAHGLVLLAIDSRAHTWDVIAGGLGPDVAFIDQALERVFGAIPIDPDRVAVNGFSDGASYALSLGLSNGDLFDAVVAFSPGSVVVDEPVGRPRVFLSHGRDDRVLPIARSSRRIVPRLAEQGVDVRYEEYSGGHTVPPAILDAGVDWLLAGWDLTATATPAPR